MAQVQIAVGGVEVTLVDEDRGAKHLQKLALGTLADVVAMMGTEAPQEDEDGER